MGVETTAEVVIEHYVARDRESVIALILDIQQNEFGVSITLDDQPDLKDVLTFYGKGAGGFWVAREGDVVVGTLGLLDSGDGGAVLRKMFVRRDRRGKERGIAARLWEALLGHARARGMRRILLGTRPEMHAAHRFYEARGFARVAETDLPASFPRMKVDSVFYGLELPP
jgi:GNAT superfamily N-acetyltransferase